VGKSTRSGDKVSGEVASPCPRPGATVGAGAGVRPPAAPAPTLTPAEKFVARQLPDRDDVFRYAKLVRPFPIRKLSDTLYFVGADAGVLAAMLTNAQIEPPQLADDWAELLWHMIDVLTSLGERAAAAIPVLEEMIDRADVEGERGQAAIRAVLGLDAAA
jgi:hypothetical protein